MTHVRILLSTYNGEKYLEEQIESLLRQTHKDFSILIRDDGSRDGTVSMLEKWSEEGTIEWYSGKNLGPAMSFLDLVKNSGNSDLYAFCDQDDVWDEDKIERAVTALEYLPSNKPALYCTATRLVDKNLTPLVSNFSFSKKLKPSLGNALARNIVTGCTAVFNKSAVNQIRKKYPSRIIMHDYWLYQVTSAFGQVIYDNKASINYRQHENNVVGARHSLYQKWLNRLKRANKGTNINYRSKMARELYETYRNELGHEQKKLILKVSNYKESYKTKLSLFFDKRIHMNSFADNVVFRLLIILGKA